MIGRAKGPGERQSFVLRHLLMNACTMMADMSQMRM